MNNALLVLSAPDCCTLFCWGAWVLLGCIACWTFTWLSIVVWTTGCTGCAPTTGATGCSDTIGCSGTAVTGCFSTGLIACCTGCASATGVPTVGCSTGVEVCCGIAAGCSLKTTLFIPT